MDREIMRVHAHSTSATAVVGYHLHHSEERAREEAEVLGALQLVQVRAEDSVDCRHDQQDDEGVGHLPQCRETQSTDSWTSITAKSTTRVAFSSHCTLCLVRVHAYALSSQACVTEMSPTLRVKAVITGTMPAKSAVMIRFAALRRRKTRMIRMILTIRTCQRHTCDKVTALGHTGCESPCQKHS